MSGMDEGSAALELADLELAAALSRFARQPDARAKLAAIFGDHAELDGLLADWREGADDVAASVRVEVRPSETIGGALGAYANALKLIVLSRELIDSGDADALVAVYLEEFGHAVDARLNRVDTPGDEGDVFAREVLGRSAFGDELSRLQNEDDHAQALLDGRLVDIEQSQTVVQVRSGGSVSGRVVNDDVHDVHDTALGTFKLPEKGRYALTFSIYSSFQSIYLDVYEGQGGVGNGKRLLGVDQSYGSVGAASAGDADSDFTVWYGSFGTYSSKPLLFTYADPERWAIYHRLRESASAEFLRQQLLHRHHQAQDRQSDRGRGQDQDQGAQRRKDHRRPRQRRSPDAADRSDHPDRRRPAALRQGDRQGRQAGLHPDRLEPDHPSRGRFHDALRLHGGLEIAQPWKDGFHNLSQQQLTIKADLTGDNYLQIKGGVVDVKGTLSIENARITPTFRIDKALVRIATTGGVVQNFGGDFQVGFGDLLGSKAFSIGATADWKYDAAGKHCNLDALGLKYSQSIPIGNTGFVFQSGQIAVRGLAPADAGATTDTNPLRLSLDNLEITGGPKEIFDLPDSWFTSAAHFEFSAVDLQFNASFGVDKTNGDFIGTAGVAVYFGLPQFLKLNVQGALNITHLTGSLTGSASLFGGAVSGAGTDLPNWLTYDAVSRTFSARAPAAPALAKTVTVVASDPNGGQASAAFTVTVTSENHAPTMTAGTFTAKPGDLLDTDNPLLISRAPF